MITDEELDRQIAELESRKSKLERLIQLRAEVAGLETGRDKISLCAAIVGVVAADFDVKAEVITGPMRTEMVCFPRQVAMYLASTVAFASPQVVGKYFHRDRGTVLHAIKVVSNRCATGKNTTWIANLKQQVRTIINKETTNGCDGKRA